mgnify:CR=1 FL=1
MIAAERVYRTADNRLCAEDDPAAAFLVCNVGEVIPVEFEAQYMGAEKPSEPHTAKVDASPVETPEAAETAPEDAHTSKLVLPSRSGSRDEWASVAKSLGIEPGELKRNELIALVDATGAK